MVFEIIKIRKKGIKKIENIKIRVFSIPSLTINGITRLINKQPIKNVPKNIVVSSVTRIGSLFIPEYKNRINREQTFPIKINSIEKIYLL